jgi:hypothetical protein
MGGGPAAAAFAAAAAAFALVILDHTTYPPMTTKRIASETHNQRRCRPEGLVLMGWALSAGIAVTGVGTGALGAAVSPRFSGGSSDVIVELSSIM